MDKNRSEKKLTHFSLTFQKVKQKFLCNQCTTTYKNISNICFLKASIIVAYKSPQKTKIMPAEEIERYIEVNRDFHRHSINRLLMPIQPHSQ